MTRKELLAACAGGMTFTAETAQAIAEGRKTRTMRAIEWPECGALSDANMRFEARGDTMFCFGCLRAEESSLVCQAKPKYSPGDIVYVELPDGVTNADPTFLRITAVKAQRANDLTVEESIAEGCDGVPCEHCNGISCTDCMNSGWLEPPSVGFMELFRSIYPPEQYGENPLCWAYEFEKIQQEDTP